VFGHDIQYPGVDVRIIERWIFRQCDVGTRTGSIWLRIGQVAGTYECMSSNEPSGSIKWEGFLD
jgi:hypothetical protein